MQEDLREHFEREYEGEAQLGNSEAEEKRKFFSDITGKISQLVIVPFINSASLRINAV